MMMTAMTQTMKRLLPVWLQTQIQTTQIQKMKIVHDAGGGEDDAVDAAEVEDDNAPKPSQKRIQIAVAIPVTTTMMKTTSPNCCSKKTLRTLSASRPRNPDTNRVVDARPQKLTMTRTNPKPHGQTAMMTMTQTNVHLDEAAVVDAAEDEAAVVDRLLNPLPAMMTLIVQMIQKTSVSTSKTTTTPLRRKTNVRDDKAQDNNGPLVPVQSDRTTMIVLDNVHAGTKSKTKMPMTIDHVVEVVGQNRVSLRSSRTFRPGKMRSPVCRSSRLVQTTRIDVSLDAEINVDVVTKINVRSGPG